ncbi:MAG: hypothetical protein KAH18_00265 [Psychromonas sp.]|nr:hypothetical protein [Psychromonas sp.]
MFKKIILLFAFTLLSACSTLSSDDDLSNAVEHVINKPTYVSVVGQKLKPDDLSENGAGVMRSIVVITANIAKKGKHAPSSKVTMTLSFIDNYKRYEYAEINAVKVKIKADSVSTRVCTDQCVATQHFSFPVKNKDLLKAINHTFTFKLRQNQHGKILKFRVPGEYVNTLLNSYNLTSLQNVAIATPVSYQTSEQSPVKMSQALFIKASDHDKKQFTDWAFKNRKSIKQPLKSKDKILTMLEYWYKKANIDEKAQIVSWTLLQ